MLSNACKYSKTDSPVTVSVWSDAGAAHITVTDQGIGMTADDIQRVFDPFYRANAAKSVQGTGLGMSLVQEIVSAYGDDIDIKSEIGRGTAVTLSLPR